MGREIHLLLPDLLAKGLGQSGISLPRLPALERLLSRAGRRAHPDTDADRYASTLLGIAGSEPPLGALCRLAETGRKDERYWFRAEPVHLLADRDRLLLDERRPALSPDEALRLVTELNEHFREDGLALEAGSPSRWYLSSREAPDLHTRPPEEAARGDIRPCMPTGKDALRWHARLNEMQMLLHTSPVNAERQARGGIPVNGLWIWGGGVLPDLSAAGDFALWASDDACGSRGAAELAGARVMAVPDSVDQVLGGSTSRAIVVATEFRDYLQRRDLDGWLRTVENWEGNWFRPLLQSLKRGQIDRLELWGGGDVRFVLTPPVAWRLWRRPRSLARIEQFAGPTDVD